MSKTRNEIASEYCTELWREYYDKHSDEKTELKKNIEQAERFLKKLQACEE